MLVVVVAKVDAPLIWPHLVGREERDRIHNGTDSAHQVYDDESDLQVPRVGLRPSARTLSQQGVEETTFFGRASVILRWLAGYVETVNTSAVYSKPNR